MYKWFFMVMVLLVSSEAIGSTLVSSLPSMSDEIGDFEDSHPDSEVNVYPRYSKYSKVPDRRLNISPSNGCGFKERRLYSLLEKLDGLKSFTVSGRYYLLLPTELGENIKEALRSLNWCLNGLKSKDGLYPEDIHFPGPGRFR